MNEQAKMNLVLQEYLKTSHITHGDGKRVKVDIEVQPPTGQMLYHLAQKHGCKKTLEVGMAYGISTLWILQGTEGIPDATHITIDPYQGSTFQYAGIETVRAAGYLDRVTLMEEKSYLALPRLVEKKEQFDLIFIDGWHTFDYVFVDFFYADKLLPIGGIVVFDDTTWQQIRRVVRFAILNLDYEVIETADKNPPIHFAKRWISRTFGAYPLRRWAEKLLRHDVLATDADLGIAAGAVALRKVVPDKRGGNDHTSF